MNTEIYHRLLC